MLRNMVFTQPLSSESIGLTRTINEHTEPYKINKGTEMPLRTKKETIYHENWNCMILYEIIQDLARPYGPYTTK